MSKSTASMGKASTTSRTEESVEASNAPPTIPLEYDVFDGTLPEQQPRRPWLIPVVLMVVTAILAVIIPVAVIYTRPPKQHDMVRQTPAPIVKPEMTLEDLQLIVPNLTQATLDRILQDPLGPQASALDWVEADPYDWYAYEDWRKVQRYALAVLFHSLSGTGWLTSTWVRLNWMAHHKDEVRVICSRLYT